MQDKIKLCSYFSGTNFSIVEDTQLLLSEKKEGIYAYVSKLLDRHIFELFELWKWPLGHPTGDARTTKGGTV